MTASRVRTPWRASSCWAHAVGPGGRAASGVNVAAADDRPAAFSRWWREAARTEERGPDLPLPAPRRACAPAKRAKARGTCRS